MGAKKKRRKLQQAPYTFTPAQLQMREDLIGNARVDIGKELDMKLLEAQAQIEAEAKPGEPTPLKDVLDNIWLRPASIGVSSDAKAVTAVAHELINEHELTLNFRQWAVVQQLVEAAVRAGIQIGRDTPA